jgi:phage tail-like protein
MRRETEKLLNMLPAIYHESDDLASLLAVFELILYGTESDPPEHERRRVSVMETWPIVNSITTISSLFDAYETPREFIPWLSQWVALSNTEDLSENDKRQLIAHIVPLYAKRGTSGYLKKILTYYFPEITKVEVEDQKMGNFVIGKAKIGSTTRFDKDRPFWFRVDIYVSLPDYSITTQEFKSKLKTRIRRVIDFAKPAHTLYELNIQSDKT